MRDFGAGGVASGRFSRGFSAPRLLIEFNDWDGVADPPETLRNAFMRGQFESGVHVFATHWLLCIFFIGMQIAISWTVRVPWTYYLLPVIGTVICLVQAMLWKTQHRYAKCAGQQQDILKRNSRLGLAVTSGASLWCVTNYAEPFVQNTLFIPVFSTFAMLATAQCYSAQPKLALGVLLVGIVPSAVALFLTELMLANLLGLAILFAAGLSCRQVTNQHRKTVTALTLEHKAQTLANTDALTNLPNRRAFMACVTAALANSEDSSRFGVAILDLDGFKPINDRLGHIAGDRLLEIVGQRLRSHLAVSDTVGRLGGDEFAFHFHHTAGPNEIAARATGILAALRMPVNVDGEIITISASMGFAAYPEDGTTLSDLLTVADTALYAAKHNGRAQIKRGSAAVTQLQRHALKHDAA